MFKSLPKNSRLCKAKVSDAVLMIVKVKLWHSAKKPKGWGIAQVSHPPFFLRSLNACEHLHFKIFTSILPDNLLWHFSSKNLIKGLNANSKRDHRLTGYTPMELILLHQRLHRKISERGCEGKRRQDYEECAQAFIKIIILIIQYQICN